MDFVRRVLLLMHGDKSVEDDTRVSDYWNVLEDDHLPSLQGRKILLQATERVLTLNFMSKFL